MRMNRVMKPGLYRANFENKNWYPPEYGITVYAEQEVDMGEVFYINGDTDPEDDRRMSLYPLLQNGIVKYARRKSTLIPRPWRKTRDRFIPLNDDEIGEVLKAVEPNLLHDLVKRHLKGG